MNRHLVAMFLFWSIGTPCVKADVPALPMRQLPWGAVDVVAPQDEWWSEIEAGWFGGLMGGTLGIAGGILGTLAGLGRARSLVLTASLAFACFGATALLAGIAAVTGGQPYHVYFPLLLGGAVMAFVFGINYPAMKRRYDGITARQHYASD